MFELKRIEQDNLMDCCKYNYDFILDDSVIRFYQAGNRDLYFTCYSSDYKKEIDLNINIFENYQLYKELENLYFNLTNQDSESLVRKQAVESLFDGNFISWESDDCVDIPINDDDKIYNYLNIYKYENEFVLKFINNSKRKNFSVAFNTDRSKYGSLVYYFMDLLNKLEDVTEEYHQISIDEWLTVKKLSKKL